MGQGSVPLPPQTYVCQQLEGFFATSPPEELCRNFLVHENPRFLRITGSALKSQVVEDELIDHEVMSVIIRRYCQSDQEADKHSPYLTWRHPTEPEFSTMVLSDYDYLHWCQSRKHCVPTHSNMTSHQLSCSSRRSHGPKDGL